MAMMGMVGSVVRSVLGGDGGAVRDVVEVFRPNAEAADQRSVDYAKTALAQLGAEFQHERRGWFDRLVDGLNRLPRPAMALGTLALFVSAMYAPVWFAERMQGLALVPEPLWWLLGAVVTFYFGARHQAKAQDWQKSIAASMSRVPQVTDNLRQLQSLHHEPVSVEPSDQAEPQDRVEPMMRRPEPETTRPTEARETPVRLPEEDHPGIAATDETDEPEVLRGAVKDFDTGNDPLNQWLQIASRA